MSEAKDFVEATISSKPVVIFSKSYCPYCVKVKTLFRDTIKVAEDKLVVVELENRTDCNAVQAYLKDKTGASSVPRVFVGGQNIGGCDDTHRQHESGELKKKLVEAKAIDA